MLMSTLHKTTNNISLIGQSVDHNQLHKTISYQSSQKVIEISQEVKKNLHNIMKSSPNNSQIISERVPTGSSQSWQHCWLALGIWVVHFSQSSGKIG